MNINERAQLAVDNGWFQISRKHRIIARLPDVGKTRAGAVALMAEASGRPLGEERLAVNDANHYLRVYATRRMQLSKEGFRAFRRACGPRGGTANPELFERLAP